MTTCGITQYHACYFALELTRRCPSDSLQKLAATLADAQVDLNPHQVDAALFAFRSPLSKGAHRDAVAEFPSGIVRPRQLHRRARLRRPQELPGTVCQPEPAAGVRHAEGSFEA